MNQSFQSKILFQVFKFINFKEKVEKRANKQILRSNKEFVPKFIKSNYLTKIQSIHSKEIATFEKKENAAKNHIVFFHGGAYIFEISFSHWILAKKIVEKCSCRMTIVDYPLAPEHNYKDTFDMVQEAYEMLIKKYSEDNLILMGDSSGGGLALAFLQKLIKEKHTFIPIKCVLLSPWLDLTMSNENIKKLESTDHILSLNMLKNAGRKYSNGDNQENYLLSPINGELRKIPKTIIFYGTDELFYADCIKLKSMIGTDKDNFIFRKYPNMQHDWALFPIPESKKLIQEICKFIEE